MSTTGVALDWKMRSEDGDYGVHGGALCALERKIRRFIRVSRLHANAQGKGQERLAPQEDPSCSGFLRMIMNMGPALVRDGLFDDAHVGGCL